MTIRMQDFWPALADAIEKPATPSAMAELLDDYRGVWPHVEADVAQNPADRDLLARALAIRDGATAPG